MCNVKNEEQIFSMAPCLKKGLLAESGLKMAKAAWNQGDSRFSALNKVIGAYYLWNQKEDALKSIDDPTPILVNALNNVTENLNSTLVPSLLPEPEKTNPSDKSTPDVVRVTGDHYGNLFKDFDDKHFHDEATTLLKIRLERNGLDLNSIKDWNVLDAGCGGGRYSAAWASLGAKEVTGVDMSEPGLKSARERIKGVIDNLQFVKGNVLDLPFDSNNFDCVFSNGVVHHSSDWEKGISEMLRVLKPKGTGWLYVIENPGGYFWDIIEIIRVLLKDVNKDFARETFKLLGVPTNRIFYILDHTMVPINVRTTTEEVETCLLKHGAKDINRLKRGADFDRIEKIHQKIPFAEMKFGVGEHRYLFTK